MEESVDLNKMFDEENLGQSVDSNEMNQTLKTLSTPKNNSSNKIMRIKSNVQNDSHHGPSSFELNSNDTGFKEVLNVKFSSND